MPEEISKKICLISSIPITFGFFCDLIKRLNKECVEVTLVSSDLPELYQFGEEFGCKIFPTAISRRISVFRDMVSIFQLWKFFRREKFDIVHAHTPKAGLIGMISSYLAGINKRIYTVHGLPMETARGFRRFVLWLSERFSCKLAKEVLSVSPSLKRCLVGQGICSSDKIRILGNGSACGIDLSKFKRDNDFALAGTKVRVEYNIPTDAIVIGYLGRLVGDKGIQVLVEAFEKLQKQVPQCYLLLVGNIETVRDSLNEQTLEKIKTNSSIFFNNEFICDVLPFYSAMDIVTLPSRREGLPYTLLEAGAMGLPVIATKVTGCVDAVVDGVTGLLVEVDNSDQLFNAMLRLVKNPELRRQLGKQGRQRVEALFDSKLLIDKHISLYEGLIDKDVGC